MANLQTLGAISGGILKGISMQQAMRTQKLEEERLRQDMEMRRQDQEYQQAERARLTKERADRDALFTEIGGAKLGNPGQAPDAPMNSETSGIHDPRGPVAGGRMPPDPSAPDEPTMGVARAAATPTMGMAGAFPKAKPKAFDYNAIDQDMQALNGFKAQAYKLRDQGALAMVEDKKKEIYARYLASFDGNPMKNPVGFAEHAGRVSARFGNPLSPEQAFQYAKASKAYEQEGALDALKLAHTGNKDAALKAYNGTGQHQFQDIELTPAKSAYGIPSFDIVGVNADGTKMPIGNAMDSMIGLETGKNQAELAIKRLEVEGKLADRATTRADKEADNARADKQLAITEHHYRNQDAAAMRRADGSGGLTVPQQRTNEAIDGARHQLAGMTEDDIRVRTQSTTNTGRENPLYDGNLAATVRLARSRKYGNDPAHDTFSTRKVAKPQATAKSGTPRARFEADPQMAGHKLGNPTGKGWEVIGPDGKLAGYWN